MKVNGLREAEEANGRYPRERFVVECAETPIVPHVIHFVEGSLHGNRGLIWKQYDRFLSPNWTIFASPIKQPSAYKLAFPWRKKPSRRPDSVSKRSENGVETQRRLLRGSGIGHVERHNFVWMRGDTDGIPVFNRERSAFRLLQQICQSG